MGDKHNKDAQGRITFEWMEGGYFLIQHVDHEQQRITGIEIIGHAATRETT